MVIKQNRPKNGALRIQIVRQRPFEVYVNSHKFRFVFALVSRTPHFDAIVFPSPIFHARKTHRAQILMCWDCNRSQSLRARKKTSTPPRREFHRALCKIFSALARR